MSGSSRLDEWMKAGEVRSLAGHRIFVRTAAPRLESLALRLRHARLRALGEAARVRLPDCAAGGHLPGTARSLRDLWALVERYRELAPDPDVVVLDDVGHYPQLEEPDRVVDEYLAFRARIN